MAEAFWAFSLRFYERPGVQSACLALQDGHGADVGMVLFALWCAERGCRVEAHELAAVDAAIGLWREQVVQPIRQARRAMQPPPALFDPDEAAALRRQLLTQELEAERLQQSVMEAQAPPPGLAPRLDAARHNLALVAGSAGIPPDAPPFGLLLQAFA